MKKMLILLIFSYSLVLAQRYGTGTSSGISARFDSNNLGFYTIYNTSLNIRSAGDENVSIHVQFNTPEYIEQYYTELTRYMKMPKGKSIQLIERNFDYARRGFWMEVTVRSNHLEDLLWNENECFILENDLGQRVRPMVVGRGTIPKYEPIDVDGQIYDDLAWVKSFGLRFPLSLLDEEMTLVTLKSTNWCRILGSWEMTPELRSQYLHPNHD
ncbi:MAG: hypothetical protein KBA26_11665 [Candidatus Delongbacteria bacterium]|nr:hypothetical protein [Candidatus Delongbacteria bacterium]